MSRPTTRTIRSAPTRRTSNTKRRGNRSRVLDSDQMHFPELLPRFAEVLPGSWQVRVQTPFALQTLQLVLTAQGSFRGELITPGAPSLLEGLWQADAATLQLALHGCLANGCQITPYRALLRVSFFDAQQIVGTTATGEQMTWHKQTPAA